jgi:hypothetical protein
MKKSHALLVACLLAASHASAPQGSARQKKSHTQTVIADPTVFAPEKGATPKRAPRRVKEAGRAAAKSSAPSTEAQVERIFARFLEAQGGYAAMAAVKSRIMRGAVAHSQSNLPGSLEYYSKAPDKTLTLIALPGGAQFIQAYDGRTDWMSNPLTGSVALGGAVVIFDRGSDFGRMPKASEMYSSVAYKGTAKIGGREAHVVAASRAGQMTQLLHFDTSSGLLVRAVVGTFDPVAQKEVPLVINYGAYAKVDGVMIPTTYEHIFPGYTLTFTVYEIKHNVAIDDSMFERPASRAGN